MAYLPNEVWLLIATHCSPEDLWLRLRNVSRQLKTCSESHFKENLLRDAVLTLPISLPTYDMRNPIRGSATFYPMPPKHYAPAKDDGDFEDRLLFSLAHTDPEFYRPRFMSRWKSMREARDGGLHDRMHWEFAVDGLSGAICLHEAAIEAGDDEDEEAARLSFAWRSTMTGFFRK